MSNLTVATWRIYKGASTEPANAVVQAAIDAAELSIADDLARYMAVATGTPSTRTYVPTPGADLRIHDCVSVTSVTSAGTLLVANTDYILLPVGQSWSGQARPYTHVHLLHGGDWNWDGTASVSISADWGWSALPANYTEATKILASDILEQKDIRNGVVGFAEFGALRVRANPMVASLLAPLRTGESFGIA